MWTTHGVCRLAYNRFKQEVIMKQKVIISENLERDLVNAISECEHDKIFILTDETTHEKCLPKIQHFLCLKGATPIVIRPNDTSKTLDTLAEVWTTLSREGATRHSLCLLYTSPSPRD